MMSSSGYLLAGQASELERLRLQARVWEPAGRALLSQVGSGDGLSALDVGCGCFGWLRILSAWVGPRGAVTAASCSSSSPASRVGAVTAPILAAGEDRTGGGG